MKVFWPRRPTKDDIRVLALVHGENVKIVHYTLDPQDIAALTEVIEDNPETIVYTDSPRAVIAAVHQLFFGVFERNPDGKVGWMAHVFPDGSPRTTTVTNPIAVVWPLKTKGYRLTLEPAVH